MARQPEYDRRDDYDVDHRVNAYNPRNFFMGSHIISDQISREALEVIWNELEQLFQREVTGAVVEFGCYVGTTSVFIRRQLNRWNQSKTREFHVYDSFEGLPAKRPEDENAAGVEFREGALQVGKRRFIEQFQRAGLELPKIHKGWFRDLTAADVPPKIAFAFLDGDFYESIHDSLKLVLPHMQAGGIIIVDDYAREALPGAAKAVHELLPNAPVRIAHGLGIIQL